MCLTCVQEGELRPQLLDRFGMSVNVTTLLDVDVRTQMVLDKMAYEQVRLPFIADCQFVGLCITWTMLHLWRHVQSCVRLH